MGRAPEDMAPEEIKTVEDVPATFEQCYDDPSVIEISEPLPKGGVTTPIDIKIREEAFRLYMDHYSYGDICKTLGIKKDTLGSWVKRHRWNDQREANDEIELQDTLSPRKALISSLAHKILTGCLKTVEKAGKDGFTTKDLPTYLSALSSIEKLSRLSRGLSTSISEERTKRANITMSLDHLKDVRQVRVQDPFAIEEAKPVNEAPADTGSNDGNS